MHTNDSGNVRIVFFLQDQNPWFREEGRIVDLTPGLNDVL